METCIVISPSSDPFVADDVAEIMPCVFAKLRNTLAIAVTVANSLRRSVLIAEIMPLMGSTQPIYEIMRPGMSSGRILTMIGVPVVPRIIVVRPGRLVQKASMLFPSSAYVDSHRQPGSGNIIIK